MTRTVISAGSGEGSAGYPTSSNPFTGAFGSGRSLVFGNSTNWTVPAGVTAVRVRLWGGGGGCTNATTYPGGGGGGFALKEITGLTPGSTIAITVGAGGSLNASGGTSSFGTYVSATGGESTASTAAHAGGTGVGGDINNTGGSAVGSYTGGGGAASLFGNGNNGLSHVSAAADQNAPSGGAGGGFGSNNVATVAHLDLVCTSTFGTASRYSGGWDGGTLDNFIKTSTPQAFPVFSMDMLGTGPGGIYTNSGQNGGGGGGTVTVPGPGGFPGGGGGSGAYSGGKLYGGSGLVIVEY